MRYALRVMSGLCLAIVVTLGLTGCPLVSKSGPINATLAPQLSLSVQRGVLVLSSYYDYWSEYNSVIPAPANCPLCLPPLSPPASIHTPPVPQPLQRLSADQPVPTRVASLVAPNPNLTVIPAELAALLQTEFSTLVQRVPANQANLLQGWTMMTAACSSAVTLLWSSSQAKPGGSGGTICVSPFIVREVFIVIATGDVPGSPTTVQSVVDLLLSKGSNDPFTYNGNSTALIPPTSSMTTADLQAVRGAVDGSVGELGDSVLQPFTSCMDYLIARDIERVLMPNGSESAVSTAAWNLMQQPGGSSALKALQIDLDGAVSIAGANQWGVSSVGDGQTALDALTATAGPM